MKFHTTAVTARIYQYALAAFIALMAIVLISALGQRLITLEKRLSALSRIEIKLDLLLLQGGIEYDPFRTLPAGVSDALKSGKGKNQAIKRYREATGAGLKESKDVIEVAMRRAG